MSYRLSTWKPISTLHVYLNRDLCRVIWRKLDDASRGMLRVALFPRDDFDACACLLAAIEHQYDWLLDTKLIPWYNKIISTWTVDDVKSMDVKIMRTAIRSENLEHLKRMRKEVVRYREISYGVFDMLVYEAGGFQNDELFFMFFDFFKTCSRHSALDGLIVRKGFNYVQRCVHLSEALWDCFDIALRNNCIDFLEMWKERYGKLHTVDVNFRAITPLEEEMGPISCVKGLQWCVDNDMNVFDEDLLHESLINCDLETITWIWDRVESDENLWENMLMYVPTTKNYEFVRQRLGITVPFSADVIRPFVTYNLQSVLKEWVCPLHFCEYTEEMYWCVHHMDSTELSNILTREFNKHTL